MVVHCPCEGAVAPDPVLRLAEELLAMGCYEVSLGDTTGQGTTDSIAGLLDRLCAELPAAKLAGHFHDTNHQAIANGTTAHLLRGLQQAAGSSGRAGIGGCPYAYRAGNRKRDVHEKALA